MKYQVQCKLQDTGWEFSSEHNSLDEAVKEVAKLMNDPLGGCCMHRIIDEKNRVYPEFNTIEKVIGNLYPTEDTHIREIVRDEVKKVMRSYLKTKVMRK